MSVLTVKLISPLAGAQTRESESVAQCLLAKSFSYRNVTTAFSPRQRLQQRHMRTGNAFQENSC